METKIFKTLEEQVNILRERGLTINNEEYAKEILLRENYFFLHGYRYPFLKSRDNRVYIEGTTFEELYSLFLFDRQLRNIIFKNILIIENNTKSIFSYQLSRKYGYKEKDYLNPNNFNNSREKRKQVTDVLSKMKKQMHKNISIHSATMHYQNSYGYIPLWVLVKVLSFGIISEFFSILKKEDQYEIVDIYNIDIDVFIDYLSVLSNYRNLCAHEDILYDNKTSKVIDDTKYHKMLNIPIMDNEYIYGKNDIFSILIIFKSFLKHDELKQVILELTSALNNLEYNLKTIPLIKILDRMGFPDNWQSIVDLEQENIFHNN